MPHARLVRRFLTAGSSLALAAAVLVVWLVRYQGLRVRIRPRATPRVVVRHHGDGRKRETATRAIAIGEATSTR